MFAYVLTFMIATGAANPVTVEIGNLRSTEQCRTVARQYISTLPRGSRMIRPVCTQRGYFT